MNNEENSPWQYKHDGTEAALQNNPASSAADENASATSPQATEFSWTSVEYIEHQRGAGWYILLMLLTVVLAALIYLLTKDYFATGTTIAACIIVGVYAGRKPRQITYQLSSSALSVGQKTYPYSMFKTFSVIAEGELSSLSLMPTKRLMPPVAAYFDPKDEQQITDLVGEHLPYDEHKLDFVDRLTRRLRF